MRMANTMQVTTLLTMIPNIAATMLLQATMMQMVLLIRWVGAATHGLSVTLYREREQVSAT